MKKNLLFSALSLSASLAFASPIAIKGEVDITIPVKDAQGVQQERHFVLPEYEFSAEMKQSIHSALKAYRPGSLKTSADFAQELPPKIDLGMAGTPVLDQGRHGSCVTFAVSGAIDAAMVAGDYVSQLCSLELGSYLAINDEIDYSGWNGAFVGSILQQFLHYGVVGKNHQTLKGCAGVQSYPLHDGNDEGQPMATEDYTKVSVPVKDILAVEDMGLVKPGFVARNNSEYDVIWAAKEQLAKGQRLVIGMTLFVQFGHAGAMGQYHAANDTWMLTPDILMAAAHGEMYAGHALVVVGYDDNAEVIDENGFKNKGLFKVRNSWSAYAGDQGDYYISYEHFNFFVHDLYAVSLKK